MAARVNVQPAVSLKLLFVVQCNTEVRVFFPVPDLE